MKVRQRMFRDNVVVFVIGFLAYFRGLWFLVFLFGENVSTFNLG